MITKIIIAASIAATVTATPLPAETWEDYGDWRITTFCTECNDPGGRVSASGEPLEYGDVAMNGVPMGTTISIEGEIFTVKDRCGIDGTVDIFVPSVDGECRCNLLEYKNVRIKKE